MKAKIEAIIKPLDEPLAMVKAFPNALAAVPVRALCGEVVAAVLTTLGDDKFNELQAATMEARKVSDKVTHGLGIVPIMPTKSLTLLLQRGDGKHRPSSKALHGSCLCRCVDGIDVDTKRTKAAMEAAKDVIGDLPFALIVAADIAEGNPFVKAKRVSGGHKKLPELGTLMWTVADFGRKRREAKIVNDPAVGGLAVQLITDQKYGSAISGNGSQGDQLFGSLSAAAGFYTHTSGNAFWTWEGKPADWGK